MNKILNTKIIFICIICVAGLFSCKIETDDQKQIKEDDARINEYLVQNGIDATKDYRGFYYEKITENTNGQSIDAGKVVAVTYRISTLEGSLLEDLIAKDSAVLLRHGTGNVLPVGIDYGIGLMRTKEKYRFYIPSNLAYYEYHNNDYFSSYTNFIVELTVDSVFSETDRFDMEEDSVESFIANNNISCEKLESGLYYSEVTDGTGDSPGNANTVQIHFTRKTLGGKVIRTTTDGDPATFMIGAGAAVKGLEEGIKEMHEEGHAALFMTSKKGFGASLRIIPSGLMNDLYDEGLIYTNVSPYEPLNYEVELLDVY